MTHFPPPSWVSPMEARLWLCSSQLLFGLMFSGDANAGIRQAAENVMLCRGWLPSLLILKEPPPGDPGIRYMGIP